MKKIREFNSILDVEKQQNDNFELFTLSQDQFSLLETLLNQLNDNQTIMQPLDILQIDLVQKLLTWPIQYIFPVFDIVKNCILRPNGILLLSSSSFDMNEFIQSLE